MIQPESKSNNRKSVTTMESTEESDFGLHLPENKPLESIKPDKADQMMEYVSRVVYATLTLFQCSPYVSLLKTQYSAIYNQLLDSFNDMKDFVMTEIHTNTQLKDENSRLESFFAYEDCIISTLFKLFKLSLKQYVEIEDQIDVLTNSIQLHKENIQELHHRYRLTHDDTLKESAQQERCKMFVNRVKLELFYCEKQALPDFINALLSPIEALLHSDHLDDVQNGYSDHVQICREMGLLTFFNISSVFFYILPYEELNNYRENIHTLFWK